MIPQTNRENALIQNLEDAGCGSDVIDMFMKSYERGKLFEQLQILSRQRGLLLDRIHDGQRKLDCLDYLIYQLRKKSGGEK